MKKILFILLVMLIGGQVSAQNLGEPQFLGYILVQNNGPHGAPVSHTLCISGQFSKNDLFRGVYLLSSYAGVIAGPVDAVEGESACPQKVAFKDVRYLAGGSVHALWGIPAWTTPNLAEVRVTVGDGPSNVVFSLFRDEKDAFTRVASGVFVKPGWNLLGNYKDTGIDVVGFFGDIDRLGLGFLEDIASVWKYSNFSKTWEFYSPRLSLEDNRIFAERSGYSLLSEIGPGEGFWVNNIGNKPIRLPEMGGRNKDFGKDISVSLHGWNILTPPMARSAEEINFSLKTTPPVPEEKVESFQSLWAWDADKESWYFYSPVLENYGGPKAVRDYAVANGYLDFLSEKTFIGAGEAFWVDFGK